MSNRIGKLVAMAACAGALGWGGPLLTARAATSEAASKTRDADKREVGGQLRLVNDAGEVVGLSPLRHTAVDADVSGMVARVSVKQEFFNPSSNPVEAIYTFPLPHDAAVDAMQMTIGKRRIIGQIKRREDAKKIYEQAKSQGKKAALLDQERPNIFTQKVANILPGENVTVEISYVNMLSYDDGSYEMSIPTVVGPRYTASGGYSAPLQRGAPSDPSGPANPNASYERDADKITPPIVPPGVRSGHDLSIRINLDAGVPLGVVRSVLHPINVQKTAPTRAVIALQNQNELPNRDFILRFQVAGEKLQSGVLAYADPNGKGGYFTLVMQPPQAPKASEVAAKEMVFVIDQTGSQSGWPIEKAKEVMTYAIGRLKPNDTFQLLGFNTEVYPCFPAPVKANQANIARALEFLKPIEGAGGTDIMKAVSYALKLPADAARPRIICYLTDGYVGNDMQIVDFIQKNRGAARLYPFGVGNSVNRFLIDAMAREGRGQAEYVTVNPDDSGRDEAPEDGAENAAARFYERIAQPLLLDVNVDWNGLKVVETYPAPLPDVFASAPLIIKGRYTRAGERDVTIHGLYRGQKWSKQIHLNLPAKNDAQTIHNSALPSLWARARIAELQGSDWQGAQNGNIAPQIKDAIIETALQYRLMSQYTSFVAVEEKITNPGGEQETRDVPIEMAEGVSHEGIFGAVAPVAQQKTARYRVAQGSNFSSRAGDPLISIDAPRDSQKIVAILPGGEIKTLQWNDTSQLWEARFDIPIYAVQGDYIIRVIMVLPNGTRKTLQLKYRVDNLAPLGQGRAQWLAGQALDLEIIASDDTDRVEAILPWGERVDLQGAPDHSFTAQAMPPANWTAQGASVTYILTDRAHNKTRITVDLSR